MIMKKLSTIFLYALAVVSLAWALPWLFNLLLPDGAKVPYINYSPLSHEFIATDKGESWVVNPDGSRGRDIPTAERDSLLPQQYFVQLSNTGRLADTILGREVSPKILKHSNFVFRSSPRDVNKRYADVYMIMESMPARVDFEDPKEVFRMKDDGTVEFIRIADCSINDDRTKRFTKVFADRGFKFPMADFSANVTTKKPFDAGYLMIDAEGTVYNMLQQAGTPFLKKIVLPDSVKAEKVLVMENNDGKHLGFAVTADGQTFAIGADYSARRLDIDKFDPKVDNMLVMGSIFNWIIRIANDNQISWQVIDPDNYSRIAEYTMPQTSSSIENIAAYIFPFTLTYDSIDDSYALPRIENFSAKALILNIVLAVVAAFVAVRRRWKPVAMAVMVVGIVVLGLYLFIPFLVLNDK